jgi:hypothetical protein
LLYDSIRVDSRIRDYINRPFKLFSRQRTRIIKLISQHVRIGFRGITGIVLPEPHAPE